MTNPLEPLLTKLIRGYTTDDDLTKKLEALFEVLDESGDGALSCEEFCAAMKVSLPPSLPPTLSLFELFYELGHDVPCCEGQRAGRLWGRSK